MVEDLNRETFTLQQSGPGSHLRGPDTPGVRLINGETWRSGGAAGILPDSKLAEIALSLSVCLSALFVINVGLPGFVGVALAGLVFGFGLAIVYRPGGLSRWRLERAARSTRIHVPHAMTRGRRIKVVGSVTARSETFRTALNQQVVISRYTGIRPHGTRRRHFRRTRWELHAVDFNVVTSDGQAVWVCTDELALLPHPPRSARDSLPLKRPVWSKSGLASDTVWIFSCETVAPGDLVEICGTLDYSPDPLAEVVNDRKPRLVAKLVSAPDGVVWVRVVRARNARSVPVERAAQLSLGENPPSR